MGRKCGPGRAEILKFGGPGGAGPRVLKIWWAGLGRAESFEHFIGRARMRPSVWEFGGPGRVRPII